MISIEKHPTIIKTIEFVVAFIFSDDYGVMLAATNRSPSLLLARRCLQSLCLRFQPIRLCT